MFDGELNFAPRASLSSRPGSGSDSSQLPEMVFSSMCFYMVSQPDHLAVAAAADEASRHRHGFAIPRQLNGHLGCLSFVDIKRETDHK
jgi:hypothetical protein